MRNYYQESLRAPRRTEGYQRGAERWKVIIQDMYQYEQPFLNQVEALKVQYIVTPAPPYRAV
jgi:hypothetical protein